MFSGIGGFELGINKALEYRDREASLFKRASRNVSGKSIKKQQQVRKMERPQPACIGYSEIDKYAISVYDKQFEGHKNYGDATTIDTGDLPGFDLLVGGFPCQAFSVAGKRGGFNDTRGTLFFDIARILKHKRPRHFILENVKGLLSHDTGKTFATILGVLADLGYRAEWQILNSKDFGVPQNRERAFIVGHLREGCGRQILPITNGSGPDIFEEREAQGQGQRVRRSDISATIDANYHKGTGSTRQMIDEPYMVHNVYGGFKETEPREFRKTSPTIRTPQRGDNQAHLMTGSRIRRLTPIECERLQGFPDDWTKYARGGVLLSDTQRYKMCGNAVTVNVVEAVMAEMLRRCL